MCFAVDNCEPLKRQPTKEISTNTDVCLDFVRQYDKKKCQRDGDVVQFILGYTRLCYSCITVDLNCGINEEAKVWRYGSSLSQNCFLDITHLSPTHAFLIGVVIHTS